jgi:AraC-like DNA-binding protein
MVLIPYELIKDFLKGEADFFEPLLLSFLKRILSEVGVKFGTLLIFDKSKDLISMIRAGEMEGREFLVPPDIIKREEPLIINNLENAPYNLSIKKGMINSEMVYPFRLKDGKTAVVFLPSEESFHFKEEHFERVKKVFEEFFSSLEKIENNREAIILYRCEDWEKVLNSIFDNEFLLIPVKETNELEKFPIPLNFLITSCNFQCAIDCSSAFRMSKKFKIPVGIIRPFKKDEESSFLCSFYSLFSFTPSHQKIIDKIKGSRFHVFSKEWKDDGRRYKISSIQRILVDGKKLKENLYFSLPYASSIFKETVGMGIKEFSKCLRMCYSLFLLSSGKPVGYASWKSGYRFCSSFSKAFFDTFGITPKSFIKFYPPQ